MNNFHTDEPLDTRVGHAGWSDHRYFSRWVFKELAGNVSTTGLIVMAATGQVIDDNDCDMLDDVATILTVADPRIYPLKLARLASAYGSSLAGQAAAVAAMEGAIVGPQISQDAAFWLIDVKTELGRSIEDPIEIRKVVEKHFSQKTRISGFGVPFRKVDERRLALTECVSARNRSEGAYWKLQNVIAEIVLDIRGVPANVGLSVAALSLDMGLRPGDLASLYIGLTINVFLANAVEGAKQAPGILRCIPDKHVEYVGVPPRTYAKTTCK
ncbi:MAG: hypothetical protein KAS73_05540 [Candidatus Sabulitectum sp.]|nr:hypothetical protein [Candidatus Sabulitectum sp.]